MIQYSTILLILIFVILVVVVSTRVTLDMFDISKYFDNGLNLNLNLNRLSLYENFSGDSAKTTQVLKEEKNDYFSEKLDIRKTNQYKKIFSNKKYTIWEPKQMDNYLPIGHIVTKANKYPKHFSILVNNKQTIKPDKFNIVSISNDNFGIWQPVSSDENYVSLGNIYYKEYPSKFTIRLVNKKFVVKSDVSKMIFNNKVKSNDKGYELWGIKDSDCFTCNNKNNINEFDSLKNIYSLNHNLLNVTKKMYVKYTRSYKKITQYKDEKLGKHFSIWRPIPPDNFCSLGDIIINKKIDPNNILDTMVVHKSFCKYPINYGINPVITLKNKTNEYSVWKPVAPENYYFFGHIVIKGKDEPNSEDLIACVPIDYLDIVHRDTHSLVWNNVNEDNPQSLWMNYLNLVNGNNKYVPPENKGVVINNDLTTSDIDLLDNSMSIVLSYKKNNNNMQPMNPTYIKNLVREHIARKFDLEEERIQVDKMDEIKEQITITILSRSIDKNSVMVEEVISQIEKTLNLGNIKIYNEDKSDYLITIMDGGVIRENLNEIIIDNTDYKLAFE